jgi:2-C-methyl-D-erythritol 4-phosphate cytidylyltransferase
VKVGVHVGAPGQALDLRELARAVEAAGFESLWVPEHTHMPLAFLRSSPENAQWAEAAAGLLDPFVALAAAALVAAVIAGGRTRQSSAALGLDAVPPETSVVACHDAARPFASPALFATVLAAVAGADGAVPVLPVPDTVKHVREGRVVETEAREALGLAQTPQAFVLDVLREAHASALADGVEATDDAALLERMGRVVRAVPGEPANFKVTTHEDLIRAETILIADRSSRLPPPPDRSTEGSPGESRGTA